MLNEAVDGMSSDELQALDSLLSTAATVRVDHTEQKKVRKLWRQAMLESLAHFTSAASSQD